MELFTDTQKLVAESGIHYNTIAKAVGISPRWIYRFMNDEYKDVGVRRIQRLRVYLLDQREIMA